MNNLRLGCIYCAEIHQNMSECYGLEEWAQAERLNAVDAFNDADQAARRARDAGEPWVRGVLDC